MIRRRPPETDMERKIIIAMITSSRFLHEIKPIYTDDSLVLPYTRTVAGWCFDYYKQYKNAPEKHIQDIYELHSKNGRFDQTQAELIEKFLSGLSEEYERLKTFNVDYLIDQTETYFRKQALINLRAELGEAIIGGRIDEGEAIVKGFKRIARPETVGVDPIGDERAIREAFRASSKDTLFRMPGDLGDTIGDFKRGFLVGIVASSKKGKTWHLQEIALRALFSGCSVLFVSFEMSERGMIQRIHQNLCGLPTVPGEILIPIFDCAQNQNNICTNRRRESSVGLGIGEGRPTVTQIKPIGKDGKWKAKINPKPPKEYIPCTACMGDTDYDPAIWYEIKIKRRLSGSRAVRKGRELTKAFFRNRKLKLIQFPSGSISVSDLRAYLYNLEYYEGFLPDVIVTDYADKMKPESTNFSRRESLGNIWEAHKGLAQERRCLVVTASQSNTARTGAKTGQGSWAEDISKLNLIDIGFALNQTADEKKQNIMNVTVLAQRHTDFDLTEDVMVLQQLRIGRPYLDSYRKILNI
jgi:hypothetical protein